MTNAGNRLQIFVCHDIEERWYAQIARESEEQLADIERELDLKREDELRLAHDPDVDDWPRYAAPIFDDIGGDGELVPIECAFAIGEVSP